MTITATEPVYTIDEAMAIPVHPSASVFALIGKRELRELTHDIQQNGLQEPMVLYRDPLAENHVFLLDGVNRREACAKAGVEPRFKWYEGSNPNRYVISANIRRRHLSAGQRAACAAKLMMGEGATQGAVAAEVDVLQSAVSHAVIVGQDDPDMLDRIIEGKITLGGAYDLVRRRRDGKPEAGTVGPEPSEERPSLSPVAVAVRATLAILGDAEAVAAGLEIDTTDVAAEDLKRVRDFYVTAVSVRS